MFSILSYTFFQHALLGALLASVLCACIGSYVVTRRLVIVGGGMAHASLGGVGLGAFLGLSPVLGAAVFALLSGLGIEWLSISHSDLVMMGLLTLITLLVFVMMDRIIITVAYDRDFARTQGLPVSIIELILTVLMALTIVGCLRMVGIVMMISLLSVPQLTGALFVRTFCGLIFSSAVVGFLDCVGGLYLSYWINVPSGASIIVVSVMLYFVARTIKHFCVSS